MNSRQPPGKPTAAESPGKIPGKNAGGRWSAFWSFPGYFWSANAAELFERAAFYGTFIALALYLTREVGFTDVETGYVAGLFSSFLYLFPTFTGALSDKLGFRKALLLAFGLLAAGYAALGAWQTKATALFSLGLIMIGGSFVKPIISGTVAVASSEGARARAYSIFYMVVNIGAFLGKTLAKPLRSELGLKYINFYSASMALLAMLFVYFSYKEPPQAGKGKSIGELAGGLVKVVKNTRFMALILIVAGFWAIQGQLYASMPKYVLRTVGEDASPEWLANVNPLVVMMLVVPVTHLVRKMSPISSIAIGLALIPCSALIMASSAWGHDTIEGALAVTGLSLHPVTAAMVLGIAIQGLAECFLSPRFLEYASKQAPAGEEGLYMGYSHLTTFFAWLFGFVLSGYLLEMYCPDPMTLDETARRTYESSLNSGLPLSGPYAHAHHIWYVFAGIGSAAFLLLLLFKFVTQRIDRQQTIETE